METTWEREAFNRDQEQKRLMINVNQARCPQCLAEMGQRCRMPSGRVMPKLGWHTARAIARRKAEAKVTR